jgi:hypothetical protein
VSSVAPEERIMPNEPPAQPHQFPQDKLPPDLLEWARQTFNEEEFLAGVREIEQTGGVKLEEFIAEIEQRIRRGRE